MVVSGLTSYSSETKEDTRETVRVPITVVDDASSWSGGDEDADDIHHHLSTAEEEASDGGDGFSHHGDPEVEVEAIEGPSRAPDERRRTLRAPMAPTPAEVDAPIAPHLPHADWCEICMKGRGRKTPNGREKKNSDEPEASSGESDADISALGTAVQLEPQLRPAPRVCSDDFYLPSDHSEQSQVVDRMSIKALIKKKLRALGKTDRSPRHVLRKRYRTCAPEGEAEKREAEVAKGHASEYPRIVIVDESTGNKYMNEDPKSLGEDGDCSWLVKGMHQEWHF